MPVIHIPALADVKISEEDFWDNFMPLRKNEEGDAVFELLETAKHDLNRIWTLIVVGEDIIAKPGHKVEDDIYGYAITAIPWTDENVHAFWWDDNCTLKESLA